MIFIMKIYVIGLNLEYLIPFIMVFKQYITFKKQFLLMFYHSIYQINITMDFTTCQVLTARMFP
jgi:hypothetical protein